MMWNILKKIRQELEELESQEEKRAIQESLRKEAILSRIKVTYDNSTKVFNYGVKG
jgi:hypothetical protein